MFSVRVTEESFLIIYSSYATSCSGGQVNKNLRELAEWFKAASLSLAKGKTFICSNHILSDMANLLI